MFQLLKWNDVYCVRCRNLRWKWTRAMVSPPSHRYGFVVQMFIILMHTFGLLWSLSVYISSYTFHHRLANVSFLFLFHLCVYCEPFRHYLLLLLYVIVVVVVVHLFDTKFALRVALPGFHFVCYFHISHARCLSKFSYFITHQESWEKETTWGFYLWSGF